MVFYKMRNQEMVFQLLNTEVKEDFALWDKTNNRFVRFIDGVDMQQVKFMKAEAFAVGFPNYRKSTQYIRDILIYDGNIRTQYSFGFKKTADDQIKQVILNMAALNQNPLDVRLKMRVVGEGIKKSYTIVVMDEIGVSKLNISLPQPANAQKGIEPQPLQESPKLSLIGALKSIVVLTAQEQQVLDLFNQDNKVYSEDEFVGIWNATMKTHFNVLTPINKIKETYFKMYKQK